MTEGEIGAFISMAHTKSGALWIGAENGLAFRAVNGEWQEFRTDGLGYKNLRELYSYNQDELYCVAT
ncbi:MAG: hypothetical protein GY841_21370, partial [FCB group bacterium]|nr:hypothetical protein [FCB group bacterium]